MTGSYCYIHHVNEPVSDAVHRICGECGHVYPTAHDLVQADLAERVKITHPSKRHLIEPLPADDIWSCTACTHDF